jgi:hypothetical protein
MVTYYHASFSFVTPPVFNKQPFKTKIFIFNKKKKKKFKKYKTQKKKLKKKKKKKKKN